MKRRTYQPIRSSEGGFVALFSVIFFALLASIITVGFIRITVVEQQQALNNDQTARALAAAEAGVEDAKRVVAYYAGLPDGSQKDAFRAALENGACDALFAPGSAPVAANVVTAGEAEGVRVAAGQNLFYTCLTLNLNTPDYLKTVAKDETEVIPLRSEDAFDRVRLEWHLNSDAADANGDGIPNNYQPSGDSLPRVNQFGVAGNQPPAYIRAQLIGVPKNGAFNRDDLENRNRSVFMSPITNGGARNETAGLTFQSADTPGNSTNGFGFNTTKTLLPVRCASSGSASANLGSYACQVTLTLPGGGLSAATNDYYLLITPLYRDARIRARLMQGGTDRTFEAVQPRIDSTGRASDVFRRVEVRTNFPGDNFDMLRYGVSVGDNICKQFQVTDDPTQFEDPAAALCN